MVSKIRGRYVVHDLEYIVCAGKADQPVSYIIAAYSTEEEAIARKKLEETNLIKLGYDSNVLKFHVEELKVFDSKLQNKILEKKTFSKK